METLKENFSQPLADIDYDEDIFFITISPNPKKMGHSVKKNYMTHVFEIFTPFNQCMKAWLLSPEVTAAGNIHYHGWFQINDHVKWYKYLLPKYKKLYNVKINKVGKKNTDLNKYAMKTAHYMKDIVHPIPLPVTHNNIKNIKSMIRILISEKKEKETDTEYEMRQTTIPEYIYD